MLGGELAVLQAAMFDGLSLDPLALFDDGIGPAEVGVGRGDVVEALVVAAVVVVLDEGLDLFLRVWCQRSILPWVWGCSGAPRTWLMRWAWI